MISEELQEQASLHALGLLDAGEAAAFEAKLNTDAELRALVRDFRDTVGALALGSAPAVQSPASLKQRVLREIATPASAAVPSAKIIPFPGATWLPWAIAALLMICCGILGVEGWNLRQKMARLEASDSLAKMQFFALAPMPDAPAGAVAAVAWNPARQDGVLRVSQLPPPEQGKDYQLWAVDSTQKEHISAGLVHVDSKGSAEVKFKPDVPLVNVQAFAISLEEAGGVPINKGPVLMIGKL